MNGSANQKPRRRPIFPALLAVVITLAAIAWISAQISNPVSVVLTSPAAGITVSNIINLTATASSLAGPITRVEFYDVVTTTDRWGVTTTTTNLLATVTNRPPSPQNLITIQK